MTTPNVRCGLCGGDLIGTEVDHGTCGHCGGRSLDPNRRQTIALITTSRRPTDSELEAIARAYIDEGYTDVAFVPMPKTDREEGPWESRVYGVGNPYAKGSA